MKKHQISLVLFIASIILVTGFKKKPGSKFTEPVKVSIAGTTAIRGDKGQRPVKVLVYLSQATTEPVTVSYNTVNGSAKAGVDYVATSGSLTFQPGEAAKWITVFIIGKVAADPDEDAPVNNVADFMINISHATGVIIDMATAYISILQNFVPNNPAAGDNATIYEVVISYTGYVTFTTGADACGIRDTGVVVLSGLLYGVEDLSGDDDTRYEGTLEMIIDMDMCSADENDLRPGEHELCGITVAGSGKVFTELKIIYGTDMSGRYDGRGGYIQIENKDGRFIRSVTGNCKQPQMDEEWTMVPNRSKTSVFNGMELPMLTTRTLRKGTYTETDEFGNKIVVEVLRKIR